MKQVPHTVELSYENDNWTMSLDHGKSQGQGHYPEIRVGQGDTAQVTYSIHQPAPGITWAQNAFCAQPGKNKPQANHFCNGNVFSYSTDTGNLVVNDLNTDKGHMDYYYVINFQNASQLDPIYNNGGISKGGFAFTSTMQVGAILIGLAVVLIVIWQIMRARAVPDPDPDPDSVPKPDEDSIPR